jgi:GTPase SAR1 family protein
MREAKYWNIIFNTSNAAFSLAAILSPMSENHRLCNMVYLAFSILQYGLCCTDNIAAIYLAHVILTIRVSIRLLDFETTRHLYTP